MAQTAYLYSVGVSEPEYLGKVELEASLQLGRPNWYVQQQQRHVIQVDRIEPAGWAPGTETVPTVYASTGGKSAILAALVAAATAAPIVDETLAAVSQSPTPGDAIRVTASGVRADNEQHRTLIRVMKAAAAFEEAAADVVARSDEVYRQALAQVVDRVQEMGALRPGLSPQQAIDILWFYFGSAAWDLLVADRQWTWDQAEQWLAGQASAAILDLPSAP